MAITTGTAANEKPAARSVGCEGRTATAAIDSGNAARTKRNRMRKSQLTSSVTAP